MNSQKFSFWLTGHRNKEQKVETKLRGVASVMTERWEQRHRKGFLVERVYDGELRSIGEVKSGWRWEVTSLEHCAKDIVHIAASLETKRSIYSSKIQAE